MYSSGNSSNLKRRTEVALIEAQKCIANGDYRAAEEKCKYTLDNWRRCAGPRAEENKIVSLLGKCYEAQQKYELAYELYMEALPHLKGSAYDDIYTSLLYLNERMGAFTTKKDHGPSF